MTCLSPVHTIGNQIIESILLHEPNMGKTEARDKAIDLLREVGIPRPDRHIDAYPFELSGGMRQRALIAVALAADPELLIADEPTTALDVTIQAQFLNLIKKLQEDLGLSILMITHNLGVIAEVSDKIVVVYAGKVVEYGNAKEIFCHPLHPYTVGLLKSLPRLDMKKKDKLQVIKGEVPDSLNSPSGCRFHPRCSFVQKNCKTEEPPLIVVEDMHRVRCWRYKKYEK